VWDYAIRRLRFSSRCTTLSLWILSMVGYVGGTLQQLDVGERMD
jgi:hypothetical protein